LVVRASRRWDLVVEEDGGAVLAAAVGELTAGVRGIDLPPVDFEQLAVAHSLGIVPDPHGFGMPGASRGDLPVGRVLLGAARVSGDDLRHPLDLLEGRLHAPEAASRERGDPGGLLTQGLRSAASGEREEGESRDDDEQPRHGILRSNRAVPSGVSSWIRRAGERSYRTVRIPHLRRTG
jgi:hypothetical protein